jgi:hypothetical protein
MVARLTAEQVEIFVSGHTRNAQVVLDNEYGHRSISGDDHWPDRARFRENQMVACNPHALVAGHLKNLRERL